ncbi:rhodanese-like domain-containing protein [Tistrella bauzanensis]|uniref:Rhodanese-like domain-containing protein n=1 Tax=Tistrella arctica TaxID=3133430 RepID=A0ABU9YDT5_9PROT
MPLKRTVKDLVMEASARIRTIPMDDAETLLDDPETLFVDIRDVRELDREGMIPGAYHAPRGMLEFWVDPESPYHKPVFASGKSFVLYCGGAWRSALATAALQDMGLEPVAHMEGGFVAWKAAGKPVVPRPTKD